MWEEFIDDVLDTMKFLFVNALFLVCFATCVLAIIYGLVWVITKMVLTVL